MSSKGKSAWLVTWEGPEAESLDRCKVVAILQPQMGEETIKLLLNVLFCSEYPLTLDEKLFFGTARGKDMPRFLSQPYRQINSELCYGHWPKQYLSARKVKDLRCVESKTDAFESTLYWTELPKYVPAQHDPNDELTAFNKMVCDERQRSYSYSSRPLLRHNQSNV